MDQLAKSEYEIQFYDVSLNKLNTILKEEFKEILSNNVDQMFIKFKEKLKGMNDEKNIEFIKEQDKFKKVILSKFESPMEKFELHLKKSLQIPENVLLPEDEVYEKSPDECDLNEIELKISNLEKKILKIKYRTNMYKLKSDKYNNFLEHVKEFKAHSFKLLSLDKESDCNHLINSLMKLKIKAGLAMEVEDLNADENRN